MSADDRTSRTGVDGATRPTGAPAPLIVAHRGAWGPAAQNSLQAFATAIELGCDMVELDVRRTGDGRLVALHNARLGGAAVGTLDYHAIRGRAPLLEEVLELIAGRIAADIELKEPACAEAALAIARRRLAPGAFVVTSFRDEALQASRAVSPEVRTGLLLRPGSVSRRSDLEARLGRTGAGFLAPHISLLRTRILGWAADRGLSSYVWTVNDGRLLKALLADRRVEAVITDRPARALRIRALCTR